MTAVMLALPYVPAAATNQVASDELSELMPVLNRLRFIAQGCRVQARLDLGTACATIHASHEASLEMAATAMIQVVHEALGRRMTFLAPGAGEMTGDESWLVRVIERAKARDSASVEFLLRRHVAREKHHAFRGIIRVVAGLLDQ